MTMIPAEVEGVSTLNALAEEVNAKGSKFKLLKNGDLYNTRSDHYNFARSGIPALFFFAGTHEDYHQTGDDWEKLDYDKMTRFFLFLNDFIPAIANADERPQFIEKD